MSIPVIQDDSPLRSSCCRLLTLLLNIRVANIQKAYEDWKSKGAEFLTPPKQHAREVRCYMRDPDGYLIEVGQATTVM